MPSENKQHFFKIKYYPVNLEAKEIINLPFDKERLVYIFFRAVD